jgi:hypothetical protein
MAEKVSSNQLWTPPRAADWNAAMAAGEQYTLREANSKGGKIIHPLADRTAVKVRNDSGGNRVRGEVLEIGAILIDELDPLHLWFEGHTPDLTRPFGILRDALASGQFGDGENLQVAGVCLAKVNVTDTDHDHAEPADGEHVLQSATAGPVRLLESPDATGEQTLAVLFTATPATASRVAKSESAIGPATDNGDWVPGSGTFKFYRRDASDGDKLKAVSDTLAVYNSMVNVSVAGSGRRIHVFHDGQDYYLAGVEPCI